jgi:hypothetical protein
MKNEKHDADSLRFLRPNESPGQQSEADSVNSAPNSAPPRLRVKSPSRPASKSLT